jgi:hypothetical protein
MHEAAHFRMSLRRSLLTVVTLAAIAAVLSCANGDDTSEDSTTEIPSATATAPPGDPRAARQVFDDFVAAVLADDIQGAWRLYAASVDGGISEHREDLGCSFAAFSNEFPRFKNFFSRLTPFETLQSHDVSQGYSTVEIQLRAQDGSEYLLTLLRREPFDPYRMWFFNSGQTAQVPGAPDPLPSPDDPQGFCGIWGGTR